MMKRCQRGGNRLGRAEGMNSRACRWGAGQRQPNAPHRLQQSSGPGSTMSLGRGKVQGVSHKTIYETVGP